MPKNEPVIALFDDAVQARQLRGELRRSGILPREMTLIVASHAKDSARSRVVGRVVDRLVDAGIASADAPLFADEVCGGATLLAVRPSPVERARIAEIIGRHAPGRRTDRGDAGEPKSGDASAEGAEVVPMPTGSGALGSRPVPDREDDA